MADFLTSQISGGLANLALNVNKFAIHLLVKFTTEWLNYFLRDHVTDENWQTFWALVFVLLTGALFGVVWRYSQNKSGRGAVLAFIGPLFCAMGIFELMQGTLYCAQKTNTYANATPYTGGNRATFTAGWPWEGSGPAAGAGGHVPAAGEVVSLVNQQLLDSLVTFDGDSGDATLFFAEYANLIIFLWLILVIAKGDLTAYNKALITFSVICILKSVLALSSAIPDVNGKGRCTGASGTFQHCFMESLVGSDGVTWPADTGVVPSNDASNNSCGDTVFSVQAALLLTFSFGLYDLALGQAGSETGLVNVLLTIFISLFLFTNATVVLENGVHYSMDVITGYVVAALAYCKLNGGPQSKSFGHDVFSVLEDPSSVVTDDSG